MPPNGPASLEPEYVAEFLEIQLGRVLLFTKGISSPKSRRIFSRRERLVSTSSPEYSSTVSTALPFPPTRSMVTGKTKKPENEIQHVCTGFLDGRLGGGRDLAAQRVQLFVIMKDRERLANACGRVKVERYIPAVCLGMVFRGRGLGIGLRDRQEREFLIIKQASEHGVEGHADDALACR